MPGSPTTVKSIGVPVACTRANDCRSNASSSARPTNGIVRRADRVVRPWTGNAVSWVSNPFAGTVRASAKDTDVSVSARASSPTSTSPGAAAACSRAAALTTGPVIRSWEDGPDARRRLARLHANVDLERPVESELLAEPPEPSADREPRSHRADRVVLVRLGEAEDGHDRVADELLRLATQRVELLGRRVVEAPEDLAGALGIEPAREPGGVHQIGEQDRDHPAFLGRQGRAERRAAVRTELRPFGSVRAADRARHRIKG